MSLNYSHPSPRSRSPAIHHRASGTSRPALPSVWASLINHHLDEAGQAAEAHSCLGDPTSVVGRQQLQPTGETLGGSQLRPGTGQEGWPHQQVEPTGVRRQQGEEFQPHGHWGGSGIDEGHRLASREKSPIPGAQARTTVTNPMPLSGLGGGGDLGAPQDMRLEVAALTGDRVPAITGFAEDPQQYDNQMWHGREEGDEEDEELPATPSQDADGEAAAPGVIPGIIA